MGKSDVEDMSPTSRLWNRRPSALPWKRRPSALPSPHQLGVASSMAATQGHGMLPALALWTSGDVKAAAATAGAANAKAGAPSAEAEFLASLLSKMQESEERVCSRVEALLSPGAAAPGFAAPELTRALDSVIGAVDNFCERFEALLHSAHSAFLLSD